ncbi:MAG: endolytic transglycosylase MltG, partial [Crocinitomicaceae bacterium]|nr:endolytic transglycosylase MltG [Crocinitomicaceae bacterium]
MKKIIALIVVLIIGVAGFVWGWPMYQLHFSTIDLKENKLIYVATGTTLDELALQLDEEKIIDQDKFKDFASKLDFDDSKIEPGKYEVKAGMKIKNLIYGFKNGNQEIKDVKITFNNCVDLYDLAGKVAPSIEADSAEIVNY